MKIAFMNDKFPPLTDCTFFETNAITTTVKMMDIKTNQFVRPRPSQVRICVLNETAIPRIIPHFIVFLNTMLLLFSSTRQMAKAQSNSDRIIIIFLIPKTKYKLM